MPERELRELRGAKIAYIFQEPGSSLNPVFTIGYQIREAIELHRPDVRDVTAEIISALDRVGIRNPPSASTTTRTSSAAACSSAS